MATAETSGDDFDWTREAYLNADLVAAVLITFRGRSPGADDDERPSTSALPTAMGSLEWGKRTKRSRLMRIPRILPLTREEEEREITEATAAVEAKVDKSKGKRRRASPKSPLEGYSSASASGGEEGTKAGRSTGGSIAAPDSHFLFEVMTHSHFLFEVAATNQRASTVSRLVRRPSSKKMTKVELQAMQMSLLEEKSKLLEEIGTWRKTLEEMRVDNSKLKISNYGGMWFILLFICIFLWVFLSSSGVVSGLTGGEMSNSASLVVHLPIYLPSSRAC